MKLKEIFDLAVQDHKKNNFQEAIKLYNKILKINPNHFDTINNLGAAFISLGDNQESVNCFKKATEIDPNNLQAHNNLGTVLHKLGDYQNAINCYEKAIEINPYFSNAHNNLGVTFISLGKYHKAINCYKKAIEIDPNYRNPHNGLGNIYSKFGKYKKAKSYYEKTIKISPNYLIAYYNLGKTFENLGDNQKARSCYKKVIEIDPNYVGAYWNLHSLTSDIEEALLILEKLYSIDNDHIKAKITICALHGYKGNFDKYKDLLISPDSNHPNTRSIKWFFSLPKLPKIFFNRWDFFDHVIKLAKNSRPFYEFGVWNGISFQYLINKFKKGFGFDTFTGIPESWGDESKGTYSSFSEVPKIKGGEFIVGKFEDTLPNFFSKKRPLASIINFDADLYSSTLCALNYSNKVIDDKSILIFDEFIINKSWEEDEYKALNEFCSSLGITYEVIAVSFYSKQVAVKLNKSCKAQ